MLSRKEVLIPSLLASMLAMALPVGAGGAPAAEANSFAIRNVRVFDGERSRDGQTVVVRDGRIAAVGANVAVPDGLRSIDGAGKTLLPGLIDAHVHAWGDAQRDALRFGVTSELDMLGDAQRLPALRQQRESLAPTAQADLWSAGHAVTAPGGHGTQFGMKVPTLAADGDTAGFVAARVGEGSDYIKLIVEDMSEYGAGKTSAGNSDASKRWPTISTRQLQDGISAAHAGQRKAVVHVTRQADGRAAVDAGADGLVHLFVDAPADAGFVRAARQRGAFVVPTLSVLASVSGAGEGRRLGADARVQPLLSETQKAGLKADFPMPQPQSAHLANALQSVRALHAAGVPILAGTDAGNPGTAHGASMHGELELLVRAGLTPVQALTAATAAPATHFGLRDRGRIAAGQRADLLLVDGDPTRDIAATRAITSVWKNGYAIERAIAKVAPTVAAPAPAEVLVSDFERDATSSRFGAGWQPTTDQMVGGASTVTHALAAGGAAGSKGALRVAGEIKPGFAYPWAGVMFFAATQPMQPVDLSARKELVFHVRGDGRGYQVMLFSGPSAQALPSMQGFTAGKQWQQVRLPLAGFNGADLALLRGIAFSAAQPAGAFAFEIDNVELR